MNKKKIEQGSVGRTVSTNIRELMAVTNMSYTELSHILWNLDRKIPYLGLRKIVRGERRVDVDDLMALSKAFGISPAAMLSPDAAEKNVSEVVKALVKRRSKQ